MRLCNKARCHPGHHLFSRFGSRVPVCWIHGAPSIREDVAEEDQRARRALWSSLLRATTCQLLPCQIASQTHARVPRCPCASPTNGALPPLQWPPAPPTLSLRRAGLRHAPLIRLSARCAHRAPAGAAALPPPAMHLASGKPIPLATEGARPIRGAGCLHEHTVEPAQGWGGACRWTLSAGRRRVLRRGYRGVQPQHLLEDTRSKPLRVSFCHLWWC